MIIFSHSFFLKKYKKILAKVYKKYYICFRKKIRNTKVLLAITAKALRCVAYAQSIFSHILQNHCYLPFFI